MAGIRGRIVVAWILAILLAVSFLGSGYPKVVQTPEVVGSFSHVGYGPGFARVIGVLEIAGALLVLIPALAFWGALLLVAALFGAFYTHLTTGLGGLEVAAALLVMATVLAWIRHPYAAFLHGRGKWD